MRILSTGLAALALISLATVPAAACSWGKTAKADTKMTVAEMPIAPDAGASISIATNDISDEMLKETELLPRPTDKPE